MQRPWEVSIGDQRCRAARERLVDDYKGASAGAIGHGMAVALAILRAGLVAMAGDSWLRLGFHVVLEVLVLRLFDVASHRPGGCGGEPVVVSPCWRPSGLDSAPSGEGANQGRSLAVGEKHAATGVRYKGYS